MTTFGESQQTQTDANGNPLKYKLVSIYHLVSAYFLESLASTWTFFRRVGSAILYDIKFPKLPMSWGTFTWNYPIKADNYVGWSLPYPPPPVPSLPPTPTPDTTPPVVTGFTIPTTATSKLFSVSSFTATDTGGLVLGYYISETPDRPTYNSGWYTAPYTNYAIVGELQPMYDVVYDGEGNVLSYKCDKTLYAWAMDSSGNISNSLSDTITITMSRSTGSESWPADPIIAPPPEKIDPGVPTFTFKSTTSSARTVAIDTYDVRTWCGVAGYAITETPTAPEAHSLIWVPTKPTSYTFTATGEATAYAWVKDKMSRVGGGRAAQVTITLQSAPTLAGGEGIWFETNAELTQFYETYFKYGYARQAWMTWDLGEWNYQTLYRTDLPDGHPNQAVVTYCTGVGRQDVADAVEAQNEIIYCDQGRIVVHSNYRSLEHMKYSGVPGSGGYTAPPIAHHGTPGDNGLVYYCDGSSMVYRGNDKVLFTMTFGAEFFARIWHHPVETADLRHCDGYTPFPNHGYPFDYYVIQNEVPNLAASDLQWFMRDYGCSWYGVDTHGGIGKTILRWDLDGNINYYPANFGHWTSGPPPTLYYMSPAEFKQLCLDQIPQITAKALIRRRGPSISSDIHTPNLQPPYQGPFEKHYMAYVVETHLQQMTQWPYDWYRLDDTLTTASQAYTSFTDIWHPYNYERFTPYGGMSCYAICEGTIGANGSEILIDSIKHIWPYYCDGKIKGDWSNGPVSFIPRRVAACPMDQDENLLFTAPLVHPTLGLYMCYIKLTKALNPNFILATAEGYAAVEQVTEAFYTTHQWGGPYFYEFQGQSIRDSYPAQQAMYTWERVGSNPRITVGIYSTDAGITWNEFTPLPGMTREETHKIATDMYPYGGTKGLLVHANNLYMMDVDSATLLDPLGYDDAGEQIDITGKVTSIQIGTHNTNGEVLITLGVTPTGATKQRAFQSISTTKIKTYGPPINTVTSVECMVPAFRSYTPGTITISGDEITVQNPLPFTNTTVYVTYTEQTTSVIRLILVTDFGATCYHAGWLSTLQYKIKAYTFTGGALDPYYLNDTELPMYIPPTPPPTLTITGESWKAYSGLPKSLMPVVSGGYFPYTFEVIAGALPPGMALGPTGLIEGTPTTVGVYSFTLRVADSRVNTAVGAFIIEVI